MARILITPRSLTSAPSAELDALRAAGHELVFPTAGKPPDEAWLLRSTLIAGRIKACATDVFATEPPVPGSLAGHPRVIATSHIGGLTDASVRRATQIAAANRLAHLPGEAEYAPG